MTATAKSSLLRLCTLSLLVLLSISASQPLLAQNKKNEIQLEEKTVNTADVGKRLGEITKSRDNLKKLKERTPVQETELKALDQLHTQLSALHALMKAIDSGTQTEIDKLNRKKTEFEAARDAAEARLKVLENKELDASAKLEEPVTEELVTKLVAIDNTKKQDVKVATTDLANSKSDEVKRIKDFEDTSKTLDKLNAARATLTESLSKEDIDADTKRILSHQLFANECEIRITELKSLHHAKFLALEKARQERHQAALDAATIEGKVTSKTVEIAREELKDLLEKRRIADEAKAKAAREKAENERSKLKKAVLEIQAFLAELKVLHGKEKKTQVNVESMLQEYTDKAVKIKEESASIKKILPEDEDLNPFRESYLKQQLRLVEKAIEKRRQKKEEDLAVLVKVQKDLAAISFSNNELEAGIVKGASNTLKHTRAESNNSSDQDKISLASWHELNLKWEKSKRDVETAEPGSPIAFEKRLLPEQTALWDKAFQDIRKILGERKTTMQTTLDKTVELIAKLDTPAELLEERQIRLKSLAFWLKENPPFGAERQAKMEEELASLRKNIGNIGENSLSSLFEKIRGVAGISGMLSIAACFLLLAYRRSRGKTAQRARAAFERSKDPLYRLFSMTAWLIGEIGHYLLALIGMMLIWRSPVPQDPVACAVFFIICLMTARLAVLRILLYAEVSDEEASKLIFIDARRILKITMFGLFTIIPAMAFFQKGGYVGLEQAAGVVATCWVFGVAFRMAFRRDIILLILPSKDVGALSLGLQMLVRRFWPVLTLFIALIAYLKFIGYRTASDVLAVKALLGAAILLLSTVTYQFIQAFIDSKTTALTSTKDRDAKGHAEGKVEKKHLDTLRHMYSLPLIFVSIMATIFAMAWAFGITWTQWESWRTNVVISGENPVILRDIVAAALIFIFGYVISATIRDILVTGALSKRSIDKEGTRYALGTLIFYIIMSVTLILGLGSLHINLAGYSWLLGSAGVALGFGMTEILSNFVCGIILFIERPVQVGDIITVGDVEGDVRRISIRSTVVQTRDGVSIILPNRRLIEADVVNWSHSDPLTRLRIDVGVAYGSDVALVKKVLIEVAEREGRVLKRPQPEVSFKAFGESELSFQLLTWMPTPDITAHRRVRSDLNSAIDAAFSRFGIEIPFPQRDLHLKTTPETMAKEAEEQAQAEAAAAAESEEKAKKGISLP